MTLKEVSSVIDDINEWENPRGGSVFYVTAIFTDESVGSVGRKDHDAALEVQGLLRESIGVEQDFTLEPKGQTKTGREKFSIKGFGTPGGAATYTAPGVQGGGQNAAPPGGSRRPPELNLASSPEYLALKLAVESGADGKDAIIAAELYRSWMLEASEPASSAYETPVGGGLQESPSTSPAGVGSEDQSGDGSSSLSAPDSAGLVDSSEGEAGESTPHIHDYQQRQGIKGFLVCAGCGKTIKKAEVVEKLQ